MYMSQVINHGVPIKLMDELRGACKEFFELSHEEKLKYIQGDYNKCKLLTSRIGYDHENVHFWRDLLRFACSDPLEEAREHWPDKPANYRLITHIFWRVWTAIVLLLNKCSFHHLCIKLIYFVLTAMHRVKHLFKREFHTTM